MLRLKPQFTNQWMTSRFHLLSTVSVLHSISTQLEVVGSPIWCYLASVIYKLLPNKILKGAKH